MNNKPFKNYIVFWASQAVSQLGSSMTSFALVIWAYNQSKSALTVSLLTFFSYLPYVVVSLFAGTFVDRHRKKSILLLTDSIAFLCSVFIVILLMMKGLQIWHIYIINMVIGFTNSFQSPALSVAIGIMVPNEKLEQVSGMNSLSSSMLTVVTPMLAACISSFWGLKGILIIDMLTFAFANCILLVLIRVPENIKRVARSKVRFVAEYKEGFSFLLQHRGIWNLILSMATMNFFSRLTYENILPAMLLARSGGSNHILGLVSGLLGLGGIVGGLYISFFRISRNPVKLIFFSAALSFVTGDLLMGLGQNIWFWSIAGLAASLPLPFISTGQNLILYRNIEKNMQGRVFAARNAVQYATIPIGILLGGFLADFIFEPFMSSTNFIALILQILVGKGEGSGMAVMFLCTGILGFLTSMIWYRNGEIRKLT